MRKYTISLIVFMLVSIIFVDSASAKKGKKKAQSKEAQLQSKYLKGKTVKEILELRHTSREIHIFTSVSKKKTLKARITDKDLVSGKVELTNVSGGSFWIDIEDLNELDKQLIAAWHKPVRFLSVKVIGSGKGKKKIVVQCKAGSEDLIIKIYKSTKAKPMVKTVLAKTELEITKTVSNKYLVKAYVGETLVDKQTWDRKTLLTTF